MNFLKASCIFINLIVYANVSLSAEIQHEFTLKERGVSDHIFMTENGTNRIASYDSQKLVLGHQRIRIYGYLQFIEFMDNRLVYETTDKGPYSLKCQEIFDYLTEGDLADTYGEARCHVRFEMPVQDRPSGVKIYISHN